MKSLLFTYLLFLVACVGCGHSIASEAGSLPHSLLNQDTKADVEQPKQLNDIFVEGNRLSYQGYDVLRLKKKVKYGYPNERGKTRSSLIEVTYAVVKKGDRSLKEFGGTYFGLGNVTDFGLFPLLGEESKELIVSQTVPRGGRHWVASFSPKFRLLFDSADYGVGREEFSVVDIDKDGKQEIVLPVTAFFVMQDKMSMSEIPLPDIIFKYDPSAQKYVPANRVFQDYALRGIDGDIRDLAEAKGNNYLSKRLNILLRYIYAGKEQEAWAFFDREYRLADKEEMKSRIQAILRDEDVYKYIHRKRAT